MAKLTQQIFDRGRIYAWLTCFIDLSVKKRIDQQFFLVFMRVSIPLVVVYPNGNL
jgi:hypothetical protein